jgi:RNA polymerase sigma-32 factor
MIRYLKNNYSLFRINTTEKGRKLFFNIEKTKQKLFNLGIEPTIDKLAVELNASVDEISDVLILKKTILSLDEPAFISCSNDEPLVETISNTLDDDTEQICKNDLLNKFKDKLKDFEKTLNEKEKLIYESRLLKQTPVPYRIIGDKIKMSHEGVRLIELKIIKKMKLFMSDLKNEFLEQN